MKTRGLTCSDVDECIEPYELGELSFDEMHAVFEHLMGCAACHARHWRPWYESGGMRPRATAQPAQPGSQEGSTAGSVTVSGNWTVETAYKLVAADTGTVARAYGVVSDAGSGLLVKVQAVREDASATAGDGNGRAHRSAIQVLASGSAGSGEVLATVARRLEAALASLGLTPPWTVRATVDFRFALRQASKAPQQLPRSVELPLGVAVASCVLEMPIPADTVFAGGVAPDGRLETAGDMARMAANLPRGTRLVGPSSSGAGRLRTRVPVRVCDTLGSALDWSGPVQPPEDGPVWCTPTLEPGRAFPPADESVETASVTMIRLLATLPNPFVAIELDRRAARGIWWLVIGGKVGLAAIAGPGPFTGKSESATVAGTSRMGGSELWQAIRGRLLDAGTVTSPGVDLWVERAAACLDASPDTFYTGVDRWPTSHPGDGPVIPWLLRELGRTGAGGLPYLPFPMALELAKGLNEVHADWFPPPVMEEFAPGESLPDESSARYGDSSHVPFDVGTRARSKAAPGDAFSSPGTGDGTDGEPAGAFVPPGPAQQGLPARASDRQDIVPFLAETPVLFPQEPRVEPPRLDHLGVALPHVPMPRYLQGYYLELAEDGEIGPSVGIPIARLHVALKKRTGRRLTTIRLEATAPGLVVDRAPAEPGRLFTLTGYHVIRHRGVEYRIEPARGDVTGKRPYVALIMVPGKQYPVRGDEARIGRNRQRCDIDLPDRQTTVNLIWTERSRRTDTVVIGRHRMNRANCFLDGFEVGSEHATITRGPGGYFLRALRPFPVFILAGPPQPIKAVGKHPVPLRHRDRLLIGHDIFQFVLR